MSWLFFAVSAYFIGGITAVLDKIILIRAIPKPILYAGFGGLFAIYAVFLIPFGFDVGPLLENQILILLGLLSGMAFTFGLYFLYTSVSLEEISRIAPVFGAMVPVFTLILGTVFSVEKLDNLQLLAFFLLLLGGILVSLKIGDLQPISSKAILAAAAGAFLFAVSFVLIKVVYTETSFLNGYITGRIGEVMAGILLLSFAEIKNNIRIKDYWLSLAGAALGLFFLNKVLAIGFFVLQNYAVYLGSVSLVQALMGLQPVFILIFTIFLSYKIPLLLTEKISFKVLLIKFIAIILIGAGLYILAGI